MPSRTLLGLLLCAVAARGLLQVHTRLAGAILQRAVDAAVRERDAYLTEADALLRKADAIDEKLRQLRSPPSSRLEDLARRDRLKRVVDLDTPTFAALSAAELRTACVDRGALWLLVFGGDEATDTALSLDGGAVLALVDEATATRISGLISDLEGFDLKAVKTSFDDLVALVDANDVSLAVVLPATDDVLRR
mmetsp:Transcript_11717/g.35139  ORF Transcript_11717/g.35139 Transcript_11717/m.35139 type:complete len:193 (+) Transcript_11717:40-618(+)